MLLVHQAGSVKIGEVVRYTLTYTPSYDRILPTPSQLYVKIKNTSAIPLRAAYLHGPYTLHVSASPASFDPNVRVENPRNDGVPEFEPFLKAGGSWSTRLLIPPSIRESGDKDHKVGRTRPHEVHGEDEAPSSTWILEITSQILFSSSASVGFELIVGRDERSLELGFAAVAGHGHGEPGQLHDHHQAKGKKAGKHAGQAKGIYSKSVKLIVDDTESLWNKPQLPTWDQEEKLKILRQGSWNTSRGLHRSLSRRDTNTSENVEELKRRRKKVHLVLITHGLHSNLGADMLYVKESIDAAAAEARRTRRAAAKKARADSESKLDTRSREDNETSSKDDGTPASGGGQEHMADGGADDDADSDDEMVVVRGFNGNAVRTERGIQYLGKRLAKYVLHLTYPDQPFLPVKRSFSNKVSSAFSSSSSKDKNDTSANSEGIPAHNGSSIRHPIHKTEKIRAYKYTSISFVGHSLGGLVQTYAVAYIRKHSPKFFDTIKPVNFICLASPMLGLSNENPVYVKFALDFGLVGRTGQDLGLTWRPPTLARSGWTAMGSVFGSNQKEQPKEDPGAKPLLRVLPTGPAHQVLHLFRNRTLYSNVVNDGIVPLRTSCLLFLDWQGLGRVVKARRDNGLIGTMANWGFAELMGQNSSLAKPDSDESDAESKTPGSGEGSTVVPQPSEDQTNQDDAANSTADPAPHQFLNHENTESPSSSPSQKPKGPIDTLWSYIRPSGKITKTDKKMFTRSQTVIVGTNSKTGDNEDSDHKSNEGEELPKKRVPATRGTYSEDNPSSGVPPKTTVFESASDLLNPPLPPRSWIIDPSARARTIFHDRVYHPEDIPPPPARKPRSARTFSTDGMRNASVTTVDSQASIDVDSMRVEEKIARAYHKGLSWRKVLVRLEPDAHNNIIVRRRYANAYGWPVVKHLCDTHFADTYSAQTRDEDEPAIDRALKSDKPVTETGEEVKGQSESKAPKVDEADLRDQPNELSSGFMRSSHVLLSPDLELARNPERRGTATTVMSDSYLDDHSSDDEDDEDDSGNPIHRFLLNSSRPAKGQDHRRNAPRKQSETKGTSEAEIADFLTKSPVEMEPHRGLGVMLEGSSTTSDAPLVPEAEADNPVPIVDRSFTSSPSDMDGRPHVLRAGTAAEVGLRKSPQDAMGMGSPSSIGKGKGEGKQGQVE